MHLTTKLFVQNGDCRINFHSLCFTNKKEGTVVERALTETDDQGDEDTDHEDKIDEANDCMAERIKNQQRMPLRDLYLVALELRENIRKNCASWFNQWPPLASDITGDSVRKVVSPLLFTPHFLDSGRIPTTPSWEMAQKLDLAYVLLKMFPSDETVLPGWTGFHTILCQDDIPEVSRIGYLPVIDAPPTEYSTINTILKKSEDIANKLQLRYATLVFDEAVYAKIQHVRWKNEAFQNRFVVRLGEFHTSMSFLSAISKIFADGGLKVGLFSI